MSDTKPIDDGGLAFPATAPNGDIHSGMSLADYFARQALVGILIRHWPGEGTQYEPLSLGKQEHLDGLAKDSYSLADALIAEKRRREQSQ